MAESQEGQAPAKPKNTGMILQIVFAVINLTVMGGGAYMVYASTMGWESPVINEESAQRELASTEETELAPMVYTMDKFTVNLTGEPKRTIRLEVNLQMLGKDGFEEVMEPENRAKARDKIVRILNEEGFSDLESIQGKLFLKDKIASQVNGILHKGVVKDVFFSDFVPVQ
ncbi:flagellar basal body-associated FliL family protein [Bdellovibrio sp. SKB1291214]|uniref:flagellar basal body-associated FliL family protein n=1 Tax=Bdellovibrio sp. SKB1291214 TaxID=1732569 RepID=UPI002240B599|nr:flagellar basal body-associated FliL family protein [Bdellovibrio sp. SKB1291214]UYL09728.1 flagellar basal body-associated FliL family protein [Bdellovibrio sp. SKB1291214]